MTDSSRTSGGDRAAARRAAARLLHPDVGGDAHEFATALAAIDRRFGTRENVGAATSLDIRLKRSRRGAAQTRLRAARSVCRRALSTLPLPRRRYISL